MDICYWGEYIEFYNINDHTEIVPFHRSQLEKNTNTFGQVLAFSPDDEFLIFNQKGYSPWIGGDSVF